MDLDIIKFDLLLRVKALACSSKVKSNVIKADALTLSKIKLIGKSKIKLPAKSIRIFSFHLLPVHRLNRI